MPALALLPAFDDILFVYAEASSLGEDSYPIELGWCGGSRTAVPVSKLIRPLPRWTDWDRQSELIHGISQPQLQRDGLQPVVVARAFRYAARLKVVVSEAAAYDHHWLQRLAKACGLPSLARIVDFDELVTAAARPKILAAPAGTQLALYEKIKAAVSQAKSHRGPPVHRAGPDAAGLRDTFHAFLDKLDRL